METLERKFYRKVDVKLLPNYNYPYMMQPQPQPQVVAQRQPQYIMDNSYPAIKGRPVSSFEEARASMIDFDGSVFYFPDLANQKIYTKQINLDGTPSIKIYELAATPQTQPAQAIPNQEDLVTKKEFEQTINSLLQQITLLKSAQPQAPVPVAASEPQAKEKFQF